MFVPRATVQRLGGLDERITFDEDAEFSYRLRASGGRVVVTPGIETRYYVRNSLRALALQMMRYGYWRRFTRILHPQKAPLRIYAPPLLVGALATSLGLVIAGFPTLAAVVPMTYALFVIAAGLSAARSRIGIGTACCVALVLPCMHLSYGVGYWRALLTPARSVLCAKKRQRAAG
jgi:GT2 family glycosyltransferase